MVTETTHRNWGSRLLDSLKNIVFGVVVFGLGLGLLWWNEGRAVKDYRMLHEVKENLETVSSDSVSPQNEGKVLHVTGAATTSEKLTDPFFEVTANSIRLRRQVEMYQWKENKKTTTEKKLGGGEEKVVSYTYEKVWSGQVIDSKKFKESEKYKNPTRMQPENWSKNAQDVILGSFSLSADVIRKMNHFKALPVYQATLPEGARIEDSMIQIGNAETFPAVGDKRISFQEVPQGPFSVIAAQFGGELKPWQTSTGRSYLRVQAGTHSALEMLEQAESEVRLLTWLLRAGGWLLLTFGMATVLNPLAVIGDVVPFIGNLIGGGIFIFSLITSAAISLITIAVAWIAVRPLIGVPLLVLAIALILALWARSRSKNVVVDVNPA